MPKFSCKINIKVKNVPLKIAELPRLVVEHRWFTRNRRKICRKKFWFDSSIYPPNTQRCLEPSLKGLKFKESKPRRFFDGFLGTHASTILNWISFSRCTWRWVFGTHASEILIWLSFSRCIWSWVFFRYSMHGINNHDLNIVLPIPLQLKLSFF
jgi:hypothetical protein